MKAIVVSSPGGPSALRFSEVEEPGLTRDQVLVRVAYAGVNYIDVYQRSGVYPRPVPFVPGGEGAGQVVAVGADVAGIRPGDRVAWEGVPGSYAEYVAVPAAKALPIPDTVTDEVASALPLQGMTAQYLATASYRIAPGDTVLVHAGAGGVGLLLTQLAKALGATVLTTVSSAAKAAASRDAGADHVLGYDGFAAEVRRLTDGAGAHAVYDGVGASTFDDSLEALRRRGTLVLFGASSGQVPPVDPQRLARAGSVLLARPTLADFVVSRAELEDRFAHLLRQVAAGRLRPRLHASYPLAEAARAHRDLADRATIGKLLLAL
ncbi:quinone oxidoreductase [Spirillospora sp. NPDC049024]